MSDFRNYTTAPLGIRNNNAGNLRDVGIGWVGRVGANRGFTVFDTMENGIRAYGIDLRTKINRGLNTLNKLIPVYAPPSENNTSRYILDMVRYTGYSADKKLTADRDTIFNMAKATFRIEIGSTVDTYLNNSIINAGLNKMSSDTSTVDKPKLSATLIIIIVVLLISFFLIR